MISRPEPKPHSTLFSHRAMALLPYALCFLSACVALPPSPALDKNNLDDKTNKLNVTTPKPKKPSWETHQRQVEEKNQQDRKTSIANLAQLKKNFNLKNRMSLGPTSTSLTGRKYSFDVEDTDVRVALREFAAKYKLNLFVNQDVEGDITVDFDNLSLEKSMTLMLGAHDFYWTWHNDLMHISRLQTKIFVVDYLRLTRSGQATTNSAISNEAPINDATIIENERNSSSIQQNDSLAFWDELETQIGSLISDNGRFVINRLSGTIQVTDNPTRINQIDSFIVSLEKALHRQVEIDVRIMEVTLRDDNALGIDWSAINIAGITGSLTSAIRGSNNSLGLKSNTLSLSYKHNNFSALINALKEQGTIKVVSQPRIRVMNNQPSLIKVGTDRTYFTQIVSHIATPAASSNIILSDKPITITEGLVLSVTPQISKDRWIMLDISPTITQIIGTTTSSQGSTAPILDIKQATTLIRARDGEMVILGGLIQEGTAQTNRQVPFFSDLPMVGNLFKGNYSTKVKKELIIFLVPRLII